MPRQKNALPTYRYHKTSGLARCWVRGRWVSLGKYDSPESRAEFARIVAELAVAPAAPPPLPSAPVSVNELLLAFWNHAERHYRRADGTPTNEVSEYRQTLRVVKRLYGHTPAAEFGPLALKAVRQEMVAAGWCRTLVNQRVGRVRRAFKWAASEQLIPFAVYQGLTTVAGLQAGRTAARESDPVRPADPARVEATLPFLRPAVAAMVRVQLLTGMRPGEVCRLRPCEVDAAGGVWVYRPDQHKTRHRGKGRAVAIGPKAQEVLRGFAPPSPADYYFSPRRVVAGLHAERSANRKTPLYPSHARLNAARRSRCPARPPTDFYRVTSYEHAIARACDRAFPAPAPLGRQAGETLKAWRARLTPARRAELAAWRKAHRWHPNQLRHLRATELRREFGLEAAQVVLGHARADVTQVYAERDEALAAKVAAAAG